MQMMKAIAFLFASLLCAGQCETYSGQSVSCASLRGDIDMTTLPGSHEWIYQQIKKQHPEWFYVSCSFLLSSSVADTLSSRGLYELNPILGRGPFNTRQETIKGVAVAAVLLTEWSLRKHPALRRGFTWMNYAVGGITWGVAAHNWSER